MRYKDREIHENELEKVFPCGSDWILITSLIKRKHDGVGRVAAYIKRKWRVSLLAGG